MAAQDAVPVIPEVIEPASLDDYLEVIARAVFQAGVTWKQIAEENWGAYRRAFHDFDCVRVAAFTESDVERALMEPGILRSEKKACAIVTNARALIAINTEFGSKADGANISDERRAVASVVTPEIAGFKNYLRLFASYKDFEKDFRKRFKFMGEMNVWYFLFRVGEPVPEFEAWVKTIKGDHPRMREMVERAQGRARGEAS